MVQHSLGDSGRFLNSDWHSTRHFARTRTFSLDEWGEPDITRYDLDELEFTRKQKPSSYITEAAIQTEGASQPGKDWSDDAIDGK